MVSSVGFLCILWHGRFLGIASSNLQTKHALYLCMLWVWSSLVVVKLKRRAFYEIIIAARNKITPFQRTRDNCINATKVVSVTSKCDTITPMLFSINPSHPNKTTGKRQRYVEINGSFSGVFRWLRQTSKSVVINNLYFTKP